MSERRSILYIAAEYRAAEVRAKGHQHNFEARHASGYFDRVYSVHPVADLVGAAKHKIALIRFTPRQLVVEGAAELFRLPRFLMPLNFLLSQTRLLFVLRRIVQKNDVAIIAATDPFLSGVLALALSRMTGKPLMIRNGGNYEDRLVRSFRRGSRDLLPRRSEIRDHRLEPHENAASNLEVSAEAAR